MPTSEETKNPRRPRRRRILIGLVVLLVILAGYTTWANMRTYPIMTSIDIDAPPEQVWDVLTNLNAYPDWNPYLVSAAGQLKEGSTLTGTTRSPDGAESAFTGTIKVIEPNEQLQWISSLGPGLLYTTETEFTLTQRGRGTRVVQRGYFTGALVPVLRSRIDGETLSRFEDVNYALKEHLES